MEAPVGATRARKLTPGQKQASRILAAGCAPVEHGFAHRKNWRILTKRRTDPGRATALLRALLVLTNLEVSRCRTELVAAGQPVSRRQRFAGPLRSAATAG